MRPRGYYPICHWGRAIAIAHGKAEALTWHDNQECRGPVGVRCATRLEAEEWCAWHNHEHERREALHAARRYDPINTRT